MKPVPAILVLGPSGLDTARRIATVLPGAKLHGVASRVAADVAVASVAPHVRALFEAGTPIIGVCAAGVLIRALAPVLADKRREPAVVAVAEDGSVAIPLLGGHGGANDLARAIASALGASAAITTAGDLRFGVALDTPPQGWHLANPDDVKAFSSALLAGAGVRIEGAAPWLAASDLPFADGAELCLTIGTEVARGGAANLVYHPRSLAVGVGCESGADPGELIALVHRVLDEAGLAEASVAGVFSLDLKADEPAVHQAAAALGVGARFFAAAELEALTPRLANPSPAVYRAVGCHGVAEAAALAAVGEEGRLVVTKTKSARATCAVARAPHVIEAVARGRARGSLAVVGIGPGDARWRTFEAEAALAAATDVVGYGAYLDLVDLPGKSLHAFALGEEEARVRCALDLAARGRAVALVSSGDAGIYAMAALVFELWEREERPEWRRVAISVCPGISALQAAAARAGAPLGHDFCTISLSDLLTPWPEIERRLVAAATGDFVVALFNPASRRRFWQLARARDILLSHRAPQTPVVLARNLGRTGETVRVTALGDLTGEDADMLTLVLVGSSTTRRAAGRHDTWVYTPRGYASRIKPEDAA